MTTTIAVSDETRRKLMEIKIREGARSLDDVLARIAIQYRKLRLMEASDLFRRRLKEAGLDLRDLVD